MPKRLRTFVAVELGPNVQARALDLIKRLQTADAEVKWVERENLHWTMQFLGEMAIEDAADVCRAINHAVTPLPEFEIEVRGAGAFPSASRPRTIWLGVRKGQEEMIILHDVIQAALEPLGFRAEERRFAPHMTLGRVRSPAGMPELGALIKEHADFTADTMLVSEVVIFTSQLGRDGPRYEALDRAELNG
jgi:2'-5' RNA ligase